MYKNKILFNNFKDSFKERRLLKVKIKKISEQCIPQKCDKFRIKMRDLKIDELNNVNAINNIIKRSIRFQFGNNSSVNIFNNNINEINKTLKTNLSEFNLNCKKFTKALKRELTSTELRAIKNDRLYYLPDDKIRNNINIFRDKPLYENMNEEKNTKNSTINNENNKKSIIKIKLPIPKIRVKTTKNKNQNIEDNEDDNELSSNNVQKKLKEINNQIKYGILNIKEKEKNKNLLIEKRKNIINAFKKQAAKEVNSLLNDPKYQNCLFNQNKFLIEEYTNYKPNNKNKFNSRNNLNLFSSDKNSDKNKKINLFSHNGTYRKELPKIPSKNLINSQEKNIKKILNDSKSLDTLETENINLINSSRINSLKNLYNNFSKKFSYNNNKNNKKFKKKYIL